MRDSMIFYRSFYEALTELEPTDKAALYDAIFSYGMNFQEPELKGIQKTIWKLIKPNIDANIKKYKDGNKGGRPPKEETTEEPQDNHNETTEEPHQNHSLTSSKPNVDVDVDANDNENANDKLEQFDLFWDLYGKKIDREKCLRKFKTLSEKDRTEIFKTVEEYVKSKPDIQFRKNPLTWLNGKCWNDEIIIDTSSQPNTGIKKKFVFNFEAGGYVDHEFTESELKEFMRSRPHISEVFHMGKKIYQKEVNNG